MVARYIVPFLLAVACATVYVIKPIAIETSLYDLVGDASAFVPDAVRRHSSNLVPVVVSSEDPSKARAAADDLFAHIPSNLCRSVRYNLGDTGFSEIMDACLARRAGLASPHDVELLATSEGRARVARAALRKYYSSPIPPLFSPKDDPFCLLDGFVTSLPIAFSGWTPKDGVLQVERDCRTFVLLVMELHPTMADDTESLVDFGSQLAATIGIERARHPDVQYDVSGAPVHTAATASRCKTEIGYLTWFSIAFIAVLSIFVFRSAKWIPLLFSSLLTAAGAGALALLAIFSSVHIMTVLFGTTILGLVVDYSFHWLLHSPSRRSETIRGLLVSFATTEISLLPLILSSLPVLLQSFVFLGIGLAAALAYILFAYPRHESLNDGTCEDGGVHFTRIAIVSSIVLLSISLVGLPGLRFGTNIKSLYRPPADLAAAERQFAELSGAADAERGVLVTSGSDDLEALLAREDASNIPSTTPCLSRFMPPLSRRVANAALIEMLYAEHGARQQELLGLDSLSPVHAPEAWRWDDLPTSMFEAFVSDGSLLVPSAPHPEGELPDGVVFCRPQKVLGEIFSAWTRETFMRLGVAVVLMALVLALFFRGGALRELMPSLFAIVVVWGMIGISGDSVNMFHLLACFLLAGMGIDYAVFLHCGGRHAFKPALCSLLTSMAGFGALAFVSFPVVRSFGFVLGIGLPAAFACAVATSCKAEVPHPASTEHGASPLGLEALFLIYSIFGLRFLHFCAACVGMSVWTFSRAVRRASPSPKKVVAFTHSLADKLVVMANGRSMPKVELDGSPDAVSFVDDVAAGNGVFVLSSHCGTVEVLAALGECNVTFHAWMEFSRTSVFNSFYLRHARRGKVVIHPIAEFGPETVFTAGDSLDSGDCLVMAGDRGFGRMRHVPFGDGEIELPEGAFRFARALAHPVYFVACVATGPCKYRAVVRKLPGDDANAMALAYASALEELVREFPEQWFRWGDDK